MGPNLFPSNDVIVLQLISFQLLSLIELVTTLLLVIVAAEWYYSKEPTQKMYVALLFGFYRRISLI